METPHQRPYRSFNRRPWRSRGYLPHFDVAGQLQSVTFRLADSLPRSFIEKLDTRVPRLNGQERRSAMEELLDRNLGACWLQRPEIAAMVEQALLHFDGERYRTLAWVVMPNHVHWLMEQLPGFDLAKVLQAIKGFSARCANELIGRRGAFWQREYFDRAIRDTEHLRSVVEYIHANPVKAGLTERGEDWRWSSAWNGRLGVLPL